MIRRVRFFAICLFMVIPVLYGCGTTGDKFVFMASTIGPIDAGIVDVLENQFEKETGIRVRHVGAGTGATLKIAEKGNIDLVMVHAKSLEEKFVKDEPLKRAVVRSLEIIGEATKKIPADFKLKWDKVKWKEMAGMRHRLIYDYMGVNYSIVCDAIRNKIPGLHKQLTEVLK